MTHPLHIHRDAELTLDQLVEAATVLLDRAPAPRDGRVQPVPDRRTVRYYQSSGLVDRPARYEGREARYTYRHLLQVLAVKLLQREGQRLATIQRGLAGQTSAALEAAVVQSLHLEPALEPASTRPIPGPRRLVSVALAPGVVLTIDPSVVADPDALIASLSTHLSGASQ